MLWPKKNSYKEFDNEKKFLQLKTSPPNNNSNSPSLIWALGFARWLNVKTAACSHILLNMQNAKSKRYVHN